MKLTCFTSRDLRVPMVYYLTLLSALSTFSMAQAPDSALSKLEVRPLPSYPSGNDVKITYSVANGSQGDLKLVVIPAIFSTKITLESPSGKRITPYPYYPFAPGSFKFAVLKPGDSKILELDLSNYFPFTEAGTYRCVLTRRLFDEGNASVPNAPDALRGTALELTSEPFELRVESPTTTKLRPLPDARTGRIPGDKLDGISAEQWYDPSLNSSAPEKPADESSLVVAPTPFPDAKAEESSSAVSSTEPFARSRVESLWPWSIAFVCAISMLIFVLHKTRKQS